MNEQEYKQLQLAERRRHVAGATRVSETESESLSTQAAEVTATPEAVKDAEVSRQAMRERIAQMRSRGVEWVRPTDLIARHTGLLAGRGIDVTAEQSRRARAPFEASAQLIAERARHLPSLSAFGRRGTADQGRSRSGIGMR